MELTRIKSFHPDQMGPLFLGGNLPGETGVRLPAATAAKSAALVLFYPRQCQSSASRSRQADPCEAEGCGRDIAARRPCRRQGPGQSPFGSMPRLDHPKGSLERRCSRVITHRLSTTFLKLCQ